MPSRITLGSADFDRDLAFWQPPMARLGWRRRFIDRSRPWAGWEPAGGGRPLFLLTVPWNGEPAAPGNGGMLALLAPGPRPGYHAGHWGADFRDPSGNKVAPACHDPA